MVVIILNNKNRIMKILSKLLFAFIVLVHFGSDLESQNLHNNKTLIVGNWSVDVISIKGDSIYSGLWKFNADGSMIWISSDWKIFGTG